MKIDQKLVRELSQLIVDNATLNEAAHEHALSLNYAPETDKDLEYYAAVTEYVRAVLKQVSDNLSK
jgi:hypothetical protein